MPVPRGGPPSGGFDRSEYSQPEKYPRQDQQTSYDTSDPPTQTWAQAEGVATTKPAKAGPRGLSVKGSKIAENDGLNVRLVAMSFGPRPPDG
jgi:hypothetical protein